MALSPAESATIETHSGPFLPSEEEALEDSIARLGGALAVSLERLQARYTRLLVTPADVSSENDRFNHTANLKHLRGAVSNLAAAVQRHADSTEEALALASGILADGAGAAETGSRSIRVVANNRRPG